MAYKHTSTELSVLAREECKATARIVIGMRLITMQGIRTPESDIERDQRFTAECEADAQAIYELLNEHLPVPTRESLAFLYQQEDVIGAISSPLTHRAAP